MPVFVDDYFPCSSGSLAFSGADQKTPSFFGATFIYKNDQFTKTGSGQSKRWKLEIERKGRFSCRGAAWCALGCLDRKGLCKAPWLLCCDRIWYAIMKKNASFAPF